LKNKVCVIVPCYNAEKYLRRCLDSLVNQTMPVDILIVNDGSIDQTLSIAEEYAEKYPDMRIVSKSNAGLPQARKTGLENTDAEFVGFVDADDWVEPETYETLYKGMVKSGAEMACCNFYYSNEKGNQSLGWKYKKTSRLNKKNSDIVEIISADEALHHIHVRNAVFPFMCNKLFYRKSLLKATFPTGNFVGEDYVTILPIIRRIKSIYVCHEPFYHYWQVTGSMSKGGFSSAHRKSFKSYHEIENVSRIGDNDYRRDVVCYVSVEYMSFLIAMRRNNRLDYKMQMYIVSFVRRNLGMLVFSKIGLKYKISAIICAINPNIMYRVYLLFSK